MKIALYECADWEKEYFQEHLSDHELVFVDQSITHCVIEDAQALIIFIYSEITQDILNRMPQLEFVATRSTGYNHIDIAACSQRGIRVCTVPYYGQNTVAEHAFALLLAMSRKIVPSANRVKAGSFDYAGLVGFDIKGKTIGIIGTGHIGQHAIRMANGFDMNVLAYDPFPKYELCNSLSFRYVGLEELFSSSDIISLHCPYNEHTHHLINETVLDTLKKGVVLINTARGGLVSNSALLKGLQQGIISQAGIDVLEEEEHLRDENGILTEEFARYDHLHELLVGHTLIHHPHVLVTPHNAFNSTEALTRILATTVENVRSNGFSNTVS